MIKDKDGNEIGMELEPFDYTEKKILSISAYCAMVQQEVNCVRTLSSTDQMKQRWAGLKQRPQGSIWMNDLVVHLNKIGATRQAKLEIEGMKEIKDLVSLDAAGIKILSTKVGMSVKALTEYIVQVLISQEGTSPYPKPYDLVEGNENPYLNHYGPEEWEEKIKKVSRSGLTHMVCVTELVDHMSQWQLIKVRHLRKLTFGHMTH